MKRRMRKEINIYALKKKANWVRNKVLDMGIKAGAAHLAPAFSCTDILVALYHGGILRFNPKNPKWKSRDRFILSKGQAAIALYAVLADLKFFPVSELNSFTRAGSRLGGHAENTVPGVEAFTGSLGNGLSIAAGLALAAKIDNKDYATLALLGDGECQEGSIWEAAMLASHHKLGNLTAIIDNNGLSAIDFIDKYINLDPLADKWRAFGWDVKIVDGHAFKEIIPALKDVRSRKSGKPLAIIAKTVKGRGVSFMENNPIWHYRIPVGKEIKSAKKELLFKYNQEGQR
ncbi:MAG: transketolase [Candidatus Omnitrophica bacterium]|nr:transketolase [Candidatus Omnitrophota bacterium]